MKQMVKRGFALLMVLVMCIGMIPVIGITADAATVEYTYGENNYIYNWGTRGTPATYLSPNAVTFYSTGNASYEYLSGLAGGTGTADAPYSALYGALQELMASRHTHETDYGETRYQYQYTDCENSGNPKTISSFYSGIAIGPGWDGGDTWNREHTWPNSKGDASGNGENDIMMLRPASMRENSGRGNIAYGESSGYYHPNKESNYELDVRGDVSRIMLYVYTRWGNTGSMWGSNGVIESLDVLLKWMVEDPVDTWELGRNDSVESITGTRNVFVDYPELAFLLFGEEIPANMSTPSNEKPAQGHTHNAVPSIVAATCVAEGCTLYTCSCGYSYKEDIVPALGHNFVNDVCTRCDAVNYNGKAVKIFYPAGSTYMTANSTTDGNKLLAGTADEAAAWRMTEGEKGYYTISFGGQYLIGSTDKPYLYLSDNLTDCGWWELIECENGYYLRNTGVFFNGSYNQYLEYYSGFTVYGFNSASASAYTFRLEVVGDGNTECEEHNWKDATCTTPKTCKTCGLTEGSALGHKWQDATCQAPKTCSACKITEGEKGTHSYVNGACSVCGKAEPNGEVTTVTVSIADYAKANGWVNSTLYKELKMDGTVTVTTSGTPVGSYSLNTGKYYTSGTNWRIYQNEKPAVTVSAGAETIVSVKITYVSEKTGVLTLNGKNISSGTVVEVDAPSITFGVGNTGTVTNGQVRITAIEVVYAGGAAAPECQHSNTKVEGAVTATCTAAGHTGKTVCSDCGKTISDGSVIPANGHSYVNGTCTGCGEAESSTPVANTTVTVSIADYAKANGWVNSTLYKELKMDGTVTVTTSGTPVGSYGLNTGKYYTSGTNWRIYQNEKPAVTVSAGAETIVSVKITYVSEKTGVLTLNGKNISSGTVVEVNAPSITFGVGNTGTVTNGQVRITAIEVVYAGGAAAPECQHSSTKVEGAVAATCTAAGHTGKTVCANCGEIISQGNVIPANGHSYVNGTCTGCGDVKPAAETKATISFANKAQRTVFTSSQQVWEQNGITVTNDKSASTSAVADYANPARFYANSKLTVAYPGMTKIEFTCGSASYATALKNSISGATVTVSGSVVTVTLPAAADTFTIAKLSAQVRMNSITVYAEGGSAEVCTHTNTKTEGATAPTCTVAGHTGKTVCADCGEVISQGNVIPANGHSYVNGTCTGCGGADPDFKPECQHTNTKTEGATAPTCTVAGHTGNTVCADCGKVINEGEVIAANGHSWQNATCQAPKTCSVCKATEGQKADHNYVNGTCSVCGDVKQVAAEATISFANKAQRTTFNTSKQVWEQNGITVINDKAASSSNVADYANPARFYASSKLTISYPGMTKIEFTCNSSSYATALKNSITGAAVSVSGKVVTVTLSAPADTFTVAKLSAQVRMNSIKVYATAGGCQHDWKAATCTAPKTCKLCGETEGNVLAHSWIDATCTAPKTCSACKLTQGSALGHKWTDATCEAPETCSVCKLTQGDALGHKWTDATCEDPAICTVCGAAGQAALGHAWINATCEEYGYCDTCGAIGDDPMGHFYLREEYTAPTCETEGTVVYVCMDCDDSYTETVEAVGHELTDGACTVCGKQVEVVENEDGSVTETTTAVEKVENEDGSVTETTTVVEKTENEDGSVVTNEVITETVTKEDGTVETVTKETVKAELSNGTTATTVIDSTGSVTSNVVLSEEAIAAIVEKAPIALPIPEVTVSASATVSIDLSGKKDDAAVKVELPVVEVNENAVIVIVHEDGTEEILQKTAVTANGLSFEVEGNVTVKVVDNTKEFEDMSKDNWSSAAVNFATSREILSGEEDGKFAPKSNMTCLQLTTLLFSLDNKSVNLSNEEIEAKAAEWAETNKIIDSAFNGEETMTREQLADFIYRYAGAHKVSGDSARFAKFTDCDTVSSWARDAMIWAVEVGVINGMGDDTLNPTGKATREQVAQVLMNYINKQ